MYQSVKQLVDLSAAHLVEVCVLKEQVPVGHNLLRAFLLQGGKQPLQLVGLSL